MTRKHHCCWGELGRLCSCCGWYECRLASSWEDGTIVHREMQYPLVSFSPPPSFFDKGKRGGGGRNRLSYESLYSTFICISAKAKISLEMALHGHYRGRLYHRDIDLVDALPTPMSERRMREFSRLRLVEVGNVGSSGPPSPSQSAVGVASLVCSSITVPSSLPVGVRAGKGNASIWKRKSLRVVPSLDEETESDDVGVCPRKAHRTKEIVVLPCSPEASPSPFVVSPLVNLGSDSMSGGAPSSHGGSFQQKKPSLFDQIGTLSHSLSFEAYASDWMLEKGVVRIIDKVIESGEFASGVQGVCEACEALRFEKGKQLCGCSTRPGEPEVPDPGGVKRKAEEVDAALLSLAETDFAGLFRLGGAGL
ncbi:unnamed protein product [Lactuca saligna]|uniref:Uncharacterized protein n=1 Tax=Lactuca saligna TaxID=75948 RepID=A0AA35VBL6_LACSI|nr:unnamed protein product [Lactuca saligna]